MSQTPQDSLTPKKFLKQLTGRLFCKRLFCAAVLSIPLLFFAITPGWAAAPSTVEERMERMEREIQSLKQRNEDLENEVRQLRERIDVEEDLPAAEEVSPQATSPVCSPVSAKESKSDAPEILARYENGLVVSSSDNLFKLLLSGRVTGRFTAFDSGYPLDDEFSLERARLETTVTMLEYMDLRIQLETAETVKLKDGYLDLHYVPRARLRMGQFKVPFIWENLQSHKYLDFVDPSLAGNNMRNPGRDIGVMLHGQLWKSRLQYQLAVLNGAGDNKADNNDAKDIVGRLAVQPFKGMEDCFFSGLQLGVSGTWGDQDTDYSKTVFKTIPGAEFVTFEPDTEHAGDRTRLGTEIVWLRGPASIKSEWMSMRLEDFRTPTAEEDLDFAAWYISGTYFLTGETKTMGRTVPLHPFDPARNMWGAWELAARYSVFSIDRDLFKLGMATGTDEAEAYTFGLNWYFNKFLRLTLNYEHTNFDDDLDIDGDTVDDEDAILVQCQLEF